MAKLLDYVEKGHYPFKSYPKGQVRSVLFPGCSFPSQFPRTTTAVSALCRSLGMGVVYDCCTRPLAAFGYERAAARALGQLQRRLRDHGVERLVTMCPNCIDYLDGRLEGVEVVDVYSELDRLSFKSDVIFEPGLLFVPCPDKADRRLERTIRRLHDLGAVDTMEGVGCCGLRAAIALRGPEAQRAACQRILDAADDGLIYTYCASCLGQFGRQGDLHCRHVLSRILDIDEEPDVTHALLNRARRRFDRDLLPEGR